LSVKVWDIKPNRARLALILEVTSPLITNSTSNVKYLRDRISIMYPHKRTADQNIHLGTELYDLEMTKDFT